MRRVDDVCAELEPLFDEHEAQRSLDVLRRDLTDLESVEPMRAAEFHTGGPDDVLQADIVGFGARFMAQIKVPS